MRQQKHARDCHGVVWEESRRKGDGVCATSLQLGILHLHHFSPAERPGGQGGVWVASNCVPFFGTVHVVLQPIKCSFTDAVTAQALGVVAPNMKG